MEARRRLRLMMAYLAGFLLLVVAANWLADPYGAWGRPLIDSRFAKLAFEWERATTPYRIRTAEPRMLLLGSSRVLLGMRIEQGYRDGVLNAALPGASLDEIVALVRIADRGQAVETVVWGLDFLAFDEHFRGFRDVETEARVKGDWGRLIPETLLSARAVDDSYRIVTARLRGLQALPPRDLLQVPWPPAAIRSALNDLRPRRLSDADRKHFEAHVRQWVDRYSPFVLSDVQVDLFRAVIAELESRSIDVEIFLPPLSEYELEIIRQTGQWDVFLDWKRRVADIVPYWDFSGYDELSRTPECFNAVDFSHFPPAVGHTILRRMLGEDCAGCGRKAKMIYAAAVRVDRANVAQHLERQQAALEGRLRLRSDYAAVAQAVIGGAR